MPNPNIPSGYGYPYQQNMYTGTHPSLPSAYPGSPPVNPALYSQFQQNSSVPNWSMMPGQYGWPMMYPGIGVPYPGFSGVNVHPPLPPVLNSGTQGSANSSTRPLQAKKNEVVTNPPLPGMSAKSNSGMVSSSSIAKVPCVPCGREFSPNFIQEHLKCHVSCPFPGCTFSALKKITNDHYAEVHEGKTKDTDDFENVSYGPDGKLELPPSLLKLIPEKFRSAAHLSNSKEDIDEWRAARKKNFPSTENIRRRMEMKDFADSKGHMAPIRGDRMWNNPSTGSSVKDFESVTSKRVFETESTVDPKRIKLSDGENSVPVSATENVPRSDEKGDVAVSNSLKDDDLPEEIKTIVHKSGDNGPVEAVRPNYVNSSDSIGKAPDEGVLASDVGVSDGGNFDSSVNNVRTVAQSDNVHSGNICRLFLRGRCTRGSKCKFSHQKAEFGAVGNIAKAGAKGKKVCHKFLLGLCRNPHCKFIHEHDAVIGAGGNKTTLVSKLLAKEQAKETNILLQSIRFIVNNNFLQAKN